MLLWPGFSINGKVSITVGRSQVCVTVTVAVTVAVTGKLFPAVLGRKALWGRERGGHLATEPLYLLTSAAPGLGSRA